MCGRARLSSDVSEIKIAFGIPPERPPPNIAPSWNLAPTDPMPVAKDGGRFTPHDAAQVEIVPHARQRHIRKSVRAICAV
jgi:putative SOS response-associated peptidase YedK